MENNESNNITLGKRLRQITNRAKTVAEIANFTAVLEAAAEKGESRVMFPDLRQYLNTMIMDGTVWDWLKSQDLVIVGEVNQNTGNYEFTICWE